MVRSGVVRIHPNALAEDAISEYWISDYWAVSHALACFGLSLVMSVAASPQEVELAALGPLGGDARPDADARASPPAA